MGKYNALIIIVVAFIIATPITAIIGVIYPFIEKSQVAGSNQTSFNSIVPTNQSGITQFTIPLPLLGWNLPVNVVCTLENLTNDGVHQNAPVEINVTLTLQNNGANGAAVKHFIYISDFTVQPANAIKVSYTSNWNSLTYPIPWSYQPNNPAEFSSLWCIPPIIQGNVTGNSGTYGNLINAEYESFSDSQDVILQDSGLLSLQIQTTIFPLNLTDPVWLNFNYSSDYHNFKPTISMPISIMSQQDVNQEMNQYKFNQLQAQLSEDQKTESVKTTSLTLFILAFAFLDIGIALYDFSKNKDKEAKNNQSENAKRQCNILEDLEQDNTFE